MIIHLFFKIFPEFQEKKVQQKCEAHMPKYLITLKAREEIDSNKVNMCVCVCELNVKLKE